jgi:hypothetical protein
MPLRQDGEEMLGRWERLSRMLVAQGLPEDEARTEAARIGALEVWDGFANELRGHRAAGRQMDANVFALALRSIQGVNSRLTRRRGDLAAAQTVIQGAGRRLRRNGGLLDRLHDHWNPAFAQAQRTFESLEAFLAHSAAAA